MTTLADKLLLLLVAVLLPLAFWWGWGQTEAGRQALIYQGNQLFKTQSLHSPAMIKVPGLLGESIIHIDNGRARFSASACQNQACVHSGWLQHAGQISACLPNGVSLIIEGGGSLVDGIAF